MKLRRRILWSTVSKAFCRSTKTPQENCPLSRALRISSVNAVRESVVECPFLKPNWCLEIKLNLDKKRGYIPYMDKLFKNFVNRE